MAGQASIAVRREEQFEATRRFVDDWTVQVKSILDDFSEDDKDTGAAGHVWDPAWCPISLSFAPQEGSAVNELVRTDNSTFNKAVTVFGYLVVEVRTLREDAERRLYPKLVMFGERPGGRPPVEGEVQVSVSTLLPQLQELLAFVAHLTTVVRNLVHQLAGMYQTVKQPARLLGSGGAVKGVSLETFQSVKLQSVIDALVLAISVLATVDTIASTNSSLGSCMSMYKRMLQTIRNDPQQYQTNAEDVSRLEQVILQLEGELLSSRLFMNTIHSFFASQQDAKDLQANTKMLTVLQDGVRTAHALAISRINGVAERSEDREMILGALGLQCLLCWLGGESFHPDKKLMRALWDTYKKAPVLHLYGNTSVSPTAFLQSHLPPFAMATKPRTLAEDVNASNMLFLERLDSELKASVNSFSSAVMTWLVRISTAQPASYPTKSVLLDKAKTLRQGILLGNRIRNMLRVETHMHIMLEESISKEQILQLNRCAELLKAIELEFRRRESWLAEAVPQAIKLLQTRMYRLVSPLKSLIESSLQTKQGRRKGDDVADDKLLDSLGAVRSVLSCLTGTCSVERLAVLGVCLDVVFSHCSLKDEILNEVDECMVTMDCLTRLKLEWERVCSCDFMYWNREILTYGLEHFYNNPRSANRIPYAILAFQDIIKMMKQAGDGGLALAYDEEVRMALEQKIIEPLCTEIETNLRLHLHSARLEGAVDINPCKYGVKDLSPFLRVQPIHFLTCTVNIKLHVEDYLDRIFYNHTALSLHNWKTYGEMRNLAIEKYGLELSEIMLPGKTLEQGIDVLDIMRKLNVFVARYNYNLNTQAFIEKVSSSKEKKHLNTVNVRHVANSIRTHGTGILNTTVNCAYHLLTQKVKILSQFLFDDHIKSRLLKEKKALKKLRSAAGGRNAEFKYPVERAIEFNREIRKLGLTKDGDSYLDQLRMLITHVGNALAFVRMVRLGAMHQASLATQFVPSIATDTIAYQELITNEELSSTSAIAADNLDKVLNDLRDRFSRGVEYFPVLVNVFSNELRKENNSHLKGFYIIGPAVVLNAVEASIFAKDKLNKRGRDAALAGFTDDGFPMGLAFLVMVLGQEDNFESLNWFPSVRQHFASETERLAGGQRKGLSSEEQHNVDLLMRRSSNYLREAELMDFAFSGARTFFNS